MSKRIHHFVSVGVGAMHALFVVNSCKCQFFKVCSFISLHECDKCNNRVILQTCQ